MAGLFGFEPVLIEIGNDGVGSSTLVPQRRLRKAYLVERLRRQAGPAEGKRLGIWIGAEDALDHPAAAAQVVRRPDVDALGTLLRPIEPDPHAVAGAVPRTDFHGAISPRRTSRF